MKYLLNKNLSLKKIKLIGGNEKAMLSTDSKKSNIKSITDTVSKNPNIKSITDTVSNNPNIKSMFNTDSKNSNVKSIKENELKNPNIKSILESASKDIDAKIPYMDPVSSGILPNVEITNNNKSISTVNTPLNTPATKSSIMQKIHNFFNNEFYFFIKDYLYFIVFISICFYILININKLSKNKTITIETKVLFYLLIIFILIIINDILQTPIESLKKFIFIIIITILLIYIVNYLIIHYYKETGSIHTSKTLLSFYALIIIFIVTLIYIYFKFQKKDKNIAFNLYASFNNSINNNFGFLTFTTIFLCIYKLAFYLLDYNTALTDILSPAILGGLLIFYIICYIIYICLKLKIINNMQYLNTYIALSSICFFLFIVYIKIFMSSMNTICTTNETESTNEEEERVSILIFISILAILWLDDTRNWHQTGSIIFILVTIFAFYCIFYYSTKHPSTGFLSFWLFIEWMIIIFYRKENSKNSIHYSFMTI
jgi:hypothetical protein